MTCRAAAGPCDVAETCTGTSTACPADVKSTAPCRAAAGDCDAAERCDGISNVCPPDLPAPSGTACRASAGDCDVAEVCDGTSKSCPADAKRTGVCRPATGSCDVAESCDGVSNACPPDVKAPDGTSCGSGSCSSGAVCQSGVCSGSSQASCGPCETCDPESGGCIQAPQPSCLRPLQSRKAQLAFKQSLKGPASDLVTWKWVDGAATAVADFGNPVCSDDYAFCVYDLSQATPSLLFRSTIPAGGTCGKKPCWSANSDKGFKFASSTGNATGVTSLKLTAGRRRQGEDPAQGEGREPDGAAVRASAAAPVGPPHGPAPVGERSVLGGDLLAPRPEQERRPGFQGQLRLIVGFSMTSGRGASIARCRATPAPRTG